MSAIEIKLNRGNIDRIVNALDKQTETIDRLIRVIGDAVVLINQPKGKRGKPVETGLETVGAEKA